MRHVLLGLALLVPACGGSGSTVTPNPDGGSACATGQEQFMDVCVLPPANAAQRTACGDVTEFCDPQSKSAPNLACASQMHTPPTTPATVRLTGFVHPFSSGNSNSPVTIAVYKAADLANLSDITKATPIVPAIMVGFDPTKATDPTQFRACDKDVKVGCVPTTPSACSIPVCKDGLMGRADDGKYCRTVGGNATCSDRLRWEPRYAIDGVPTNVPLVIRTSGKNGMTDSTWSTLVEFAVRLATDDPACADDQATGCLDTTHQDAVRYQHNVNVLSVADYANIPVAAGLASGISDGYGAVAGEIHDCDDVRLGDVQVGVQPSGSRFTYFNGNPYMTLPDLSRYSTGTDRLGLYAALNIKPGPVTVEAVGLVDGKETLLGKGTAFVYANSISVLNVRTGR